MGHDTYEVRRDTLASMGVGRGRVGKLHPMDTQERENKDPHPWARLQRGGGPWADSSPELNARRQSCLGNTDRVVEGNRGEDEERRP